MAKNVTQSIREWLARHERKAVARSCYRTYSRLFVPLAILTFAGLLFNGRELIWYVDGMGQYYPFFVYEGQWLRGIVGSLVRGEGLAVPLWEWCSGYGADIPTTFDVILDPLNLVSAITPPALTEWVFQLLILLRLYLAGLAFVFYCRTRGENHTGTVLGALLYAFCGLALGGVRWPSGLHALMLFPVILAGAERILQGRRPWVFVAALSGLAIVSYYFTYMAIALLVAYLALRVVMVERPNLTAGRFLAWVGRFAGLVVLCLAIAGFALVPAVQALVGMDRVEDARTAVPLLYDVQYYGGLLMSFLSTTSVGSDTYQGFGGLAFLACLLLFADRKEHRELRLAFVTLTAFFLLPCVGSFFNGFNYATNRWAWAYDLCVAFVLVRMTPALLRCDGRTRRLLLGGTCAYALALLIPPLRTEANVAGMAALLAALLALLGYKNALTRRSVLAGALFLTLSTNALYFLSPQEGFVGKDQVPMTAAYPLLTSKSADTLAAEVDDPTWWRYDAGQAPLDPLPPVARFRNNSLMLGVQGIDFYNSVYNDGIDAFHAEMGIPGDYINFSYIDLQGRSDLLSLLGVRYYLLRLDGTDVPPYGFDADDAVLERPVEGIGYRVIRSSRALPLGVAYDRALSRTDYLALSPAQRQQALLQAVVLEDAQASDGTGAAPVRADDLAYEDAALPFDVADAVNVDVEEHRLVVREPGATLTLACEGVPAAETYLYLRGLEYRPMKPSEFVGKEKLALMGWYSRINLLAKDLSYRSAEEYEIAIRSDVSPSSAIVANFVRESHMYGGRNTWLADLGYQEAAPRQITITFTQPGEYTFEDMQVVAQTHGRTKEWTDALGGHALQNLAVGCNRVAGDIELAEPRTLLLTMAYSKGWSATVDGEPCEVLRADTGFMALDLDAGRHEVVLTYQTPGLMAGLCLSGAGVVALVALAIASRRSDRQRTESEEA